MNLIPFLFSLTIANVSAEANHTSPELIIQTSGLVTGAVFREDALPTAIRNLTRLQLFDHVAIDTSIVADGIFITIRVDEAPTLRENVRFEGNLRIKDKDLHQQTGLKTGQILTRARVFEARQALVDFYEDRSFYNTTVIESLAVDTLNRAVLTFFITEGKPLRIGAINIEGNTALTDNQIRRKMANRAKAFLRAGKLDRAKLDEDVTKIAALYKEQGYLDVRVSEPEIEAVGDRLVITIRVAENGRYYAGDVTFTGNHVFTTPQLVAMLAFETGGVYDVSRVQKTTEDLYSRYADEGYIYCSIMPQETVRDSFIDLVYLITEQEPATVKRVIIDGNQRTREKVIRREIVTMPGERFRRSAVIRSQREVFNLGYFDDIQIGTGPPDTTGSLDLIYTVKEKESAGTIGGGIAYSAQDKLTGYLELSHPNIFGRGQTIYTKFELGGRLTNFQLGFTEPWLFDTRTSAGLDVYYINRLWDYYKKRDIGVASRFSFPFYLDYTRLSYTARVERTQILDISSSYVPSGSYDLREDTIPKWTFGNTFGLTRDTRDFIFNPSSGSYLTTNAEFAKRFLFANIDYNILTFEGRAYFPIFWKFVLMARCKAGIATSLDEVPIYKRFYAGGIGDNGVRGYPDRSLSPEEEGYAVGGNALFINNLELKLKLSQSLALLAFYDMGNSFTSYREMNLGDLKRGLGVGFRVEVPMMGVIGFDLGYGFDRANPGWEPHFQINPYGIF